jgi:hypothetical protein
MEEWSEKAMDKIMKHVGLLILVCAQIKRYPELSNKT